MFISIHALWVILGLIALRGTLAFLKAAKAHPMRLLSSHPRHTGGKLLLDLVITWSIVVYGLDGPAVALLSWRLGLSYLFYAFVADYGVHLMLRTALVPVLRDYLRRQLMVAAHATSKATPPSQERPLPSVSPQAQASREAALGLVPSDPDVKKVLHQHGFKPEDCQHCMTLTQESFALDDAIIGPILQDLLDTRLPLGQGTAAVLLRQQPLKEGECVWAVSSATKGDAVFLGPLLFGQASDQRPQLY